MKQSMKRGRSLDKRVSALPAQGRYTFTKGEATILLSMSDAAFTCEAPTFALEELLGTKLRALYQRRKGRDLLDLRLGLTEGRADPEQIVTCFRAYMQRGGVKVSRQEFAQNLADKRRHPAFTADLGDLLPVGFHYDVLTGFAVIENELLARL